jgi:CheY-like chemotaxis protein/HPt (histidine-containing phosphotransfer) domain-containing protein/two-component sensor histidine kinase
MNVVLGMLELLGMTELDPEQKKTVLVVRASARSLLRIIDDILDFSKIEAGYMQITREPLSIQGLIDQVYRSFVNVAQRKGLQLRCHVDQALSPAVLADGVRLRQILDNFVSNAVKFTTKGHVEIRAVLVSRQGDHEKLPSTSSGRTANGGDHEIVRLEVSDTGIGIPLEAQARLFQPFVQAEATTTRKYGGTGLGLAICRRLAMIMNGTVELESAPGIGTTMSLILPLALADAGLLTATLEEPHHLAFYPDDAPADLPQHLPPAVSDPVRILIAEDHPVNRMLMIQQFAKLGLTCALAEDGQEALRMWQDGQYRLVLTDLHMPHLDGYDLARAIRRLEADAGTHSPVPIIACTANVLTGEAEACREAGIQDILTKPVSLAALTEKLRLWLPTAFQKPTQGMETTAHAALPATAPSVSPTLVGEYPHPRSGPPLHIPVPDLRDLTGVDLAPGKASYPPDAVVFFPATLQALSRGDHAMEHELLRSYLQILDQDLAALYAAMESGDGANTMLLAHRLKGSSRSVGARPFGDLAAAVERTGKSEDFSATAHYKEALAAGAATLRAAIIAHLDAVRRSP